MTDKAPKMPIQQRLWFKRCLLFFGSLLFSMCAVEVGFRIKSPLGHEAMLFGAPDFSNPDLYISDSELLLVPKPGFQGDVRTLEYSANVRINSKGHRGPELGPKEPNELRILALGDSFTLGVQVEESQTFSALLESRLSAELNRPVRVINAGVDGFGTDQSMRMAERLDAHYDVDAAMLLFFTGNDFWENESFSARKGMNTGGLMPPPKPYLSFWDRTLGRISYAYAFVRVHFRTRALRGDSHQLQRYSEELRIFDASSPVLTRQLMKTRTALQRFSDLCAAKQWRCFLPVAPPAFVAHPQRAEATFDLVEMSMSQVDLDRPARVLAQRPIVGLAQLDLTPILRASSEALYFRFDGHWNAKGHAVVAEALAQWLTPQWLTPMDYTPIQQPPNREHQP
jgi:lysophospholipase L1-like esterase